MQLRIVVRQQAPGVRGFRSGELGQDPGEIGERIDLDQAATSDYRVDHRGASPRFRVTDVQPVFRTDVRWADVALHGV
jgi:hypothetical protein